jgi:hypothetical protein
MAQEHEGKECLVGDSLRQVPWLVTTSSSVKVSLSAQDELVVRGKNNLSHY